EVDRGFGRFAAGLIRTDLRQFCVVEVLRSRHISRPVMCPESDLVAGASREQDIVDFQRQLRAQLARALGQGHRVDRKSTRLNSSHVSISYAVFCLKKT